MANAFDFYNTLLLHIVMVTLLETILLGNVQFNWPKLFQAFFVKFTVNFFHACVHSIIPHKHM